MSGCGYSQREPFPAQYTAVAVPIFENASFERGVEFDLAEALTKELRSRTPYSVRRADIADTVLDGEITRVDRDMLSRREVGGVPQEVEVTVSIDFTWTDARTGETIVDRRGFEAVGRHLPTAPIGEPFEVAKREAVERLARDVVTAMRPTGHRSRRRGTCASSISDRPQKKASSAESVGDFRASVGRFPCFYAICGVFTVERSDTQIRQDAAAPDFQWTRGGRNRRGRCKAKVSRPNDPFQGAAGGRGAGQSPVRYAAINPQICLKSQKKEPRTKEAIKATPGETHANRCSIRICVDPRSFAVDSSGHSVRLQHCVDRKLA